MFHKKLDDVELNGIDSEGGKLSEEEGDDGDAHFYLWNKKKNLFCTEIIIIFKDAEYKFNNFFFFGLCFFEKLFFFFSSYMYIYIF